MLQTPKCHNNGGNLLNFLTPFLVGAMHMIAICFVWELGFGGEEREELIFLF
jgi:hypothetical protein